MIRIECAKCGRAYLRKDLERTVKCDGGGELQHADLWLVVRVTDPFEKTARWVVTKAARITVASKYTEADAARFRRIREAHIRRFEKIVADSRKKRSKAKLRTTQSCDDSSWCDDSSCPGCERKGHR